jgi:hypothetical protein
MLKVQAKPPPPKQNQGKLAHSKWLRVEQVLATYPLKRSLLFRLLGSGKLRSFLLRREGATKGCRLVDSFDLDRFLQEEADKCTKESQNHNSQCN